MNKACVFLKQNTLGAWGKGIPWRSWLFGTGGSNFSPAHCLQLSEAFTLVCIQKQGWAALREPGLASDTPSVSPNACFQPFPLILREDEEAGWF